MSAADEVAGVVSAVYWTNKGAAAAVKGTYRKAQELAMWVNSKRSSTPAATSGGTTKGGSDKQWSTVETYRNTTVSTTEWVKKTK